MTRRCDLDGAVITITPNGGFDDVDVLDAARIRSELLGVVACRPCCSGAGTRRGSLRRAQLGLIHSTPFGLLMFAPVVQTATSRGKTTHHELIGWHDRTEPDAFARALLLSDADWPNGHVLRFLYCPRHRERATSIGELRAAFTRAPTNGRPVVVPV